MRGSIDIIVVPTGGHYQPTFLPPADDLYLVPQPARFVSAHGKAIRL
jgi:hypothetical protein